MEEKQHSNPTDQDAQTEKPNPPVAANPFARLTKRRATRLTIGLCILAIIIGVAFVAVGMNGSKNKDTSQSGQPPQPSSQKSLFAQQYGNNCRERDVSFSSAPMKIDELAYIRPLGAMSDGHVTPTDHVYIGGPNPQAADNSYAVLMPADGKIVEVSAMPAQYIGDRSGQHMAQEDHRIVISHSCRYFSIYIHIHALSDKLKGAVGALQPNESKQTQLELSAGETVGYIGGSTFDWTPVDTHKKLTGFITPSLYNGESWKIHTASPFDLYSGMLKTQLEAKSLRSVAPLGGKIDYDRRGKLIGNWFREGTGGYGGNNKNGGGRYWDGHLSVVPDYVDPASTIVSIGNWMGGAQQFVVVGATDPARIARADGMVKYELKKVSYLTADGQPWHGSSFAKGLQVSQDGPVEGVIALQVLPNEKLKVEKFPGKTAQQVAGFSAAAQTYER